MKVELLLSRIVDCCLNHFHRLPNTINFSVASVPSVTTHTTNESVNYSHNYKHNSLQDSGHDSLQGSEHNSL